MIVQGDLLFTPTKDRFQILKDGYLIIENGKVLSVEERYDGAEPILERKGMLIIPAFTDLHLHANQYANCGLGTDVELIEWLEKYTYPEESRFRDLGYAGTVFRQVLNRLWECGSLHSVHYASLYTEATRLLFRMTLESGLSAYIGKVNMDRNVPPTYIETLEEGVRGNEELIREFGGADSPVKPILTPRFVPHCTPAYLEAQGRLAEAYGIPVQSHLNESPGEIEWVRKLHPEAPNYSAVYDRYGLFGEKTPAIMAHCIHNTPEELDLMKRRNLYPVHCPQSNANLSSGIMPVRKMLEEGLPVSLGSDISGGEELFLPAQMVLAIQLSKMKGRLEGDLSHSLSLSEAFYMATKSGGSFFGDTGSFERGYDADFLVVNPEGLAPPGKALTPLERLQKFLYIGSPDQIRERYLKGRILEKPYEDR